MVGPTSEIIFYDCLANEHSFSEKSDNSPQVGQHFLYLGQILFKETEASV